MENRYIIVRRSSDSAFVVAPNELAPNRRWWTKADIAGYASTEQEGQAFVDAYAQLVAEGKIHFQLCPFAEATLLALEAAGLAVVGADLYVRPVVNGSGVAK